MSDLRGCVCEPSTRYSVNLLVIVLVASARFASFRGSFRGALRTATAGHREFHHRNNDHENHADANTDVFGSVVGGILETHRSGFAAIDTFNVFNFYFAMRARTRGGHSRPCDLFLATRTRPAVLHHPATHLRWPNRHTAFRLRKSDRSTSTEREYHEWQPGKVSTHESGSLEGQTMNATQQFTKLPRRTIPCASKMEIRKNRWLRFRFELPPHGLPTKNGISLPCRNAARRGAAYGRR